MASRGGLSLPYRRSKVLAPPAPRKGDPDAPSAGATLADGAGGLAEGMSYDALRCCFYGKPLLRGWLHLALFHASLVTGTLVPIAARGSLRTAAVAIYVATVSALFGTSALHHRGRWTARQAGLLQRLDHSMIFLLIAGPRHRRF